MPHASCRCLQPLGLKILLEPGRFISGNAGILVTRVEFIKRTGRKNFVIVDAAMNDLIRPAFYDAYHEIVPLMKKGGATISSDVVGGICESGDYFCKDRPLAKVGEGDHLALLSAGAYAAAMGSNYNARALATEALVNGKKVCRRARTPGAGRYLGERKNCALAEIKLHLRHERVPHTFLPIKRMLKQFTRAANESRAHVGRWMGWMTPDYS